MTRLTYWRTLLRSLEIVSPCCHLLLPSAPVPLELIAFTLCVASLHDCATNEPPLKGANSVCFARPSDAKTLPLPFRCQSRDHQQMSLALVVSQCLSLKRCSCRCCCSCGKIYRISCGVKKKHLLHKEPWSCHLDENEDPGKTYLQFPIIRGMSRGAKLISRPTLWLVPQQCAHVASSVVKILTY